MAASKLPFGGCVPMVAMSSCSGCGSSNGTQAHTYAPRQDYKSHVCPQHWHCKLYRCAGFDKRDPQPRLLGTDAEQAATVAHIGVWSCCAMLIPRPAARYAAYGLTGAYEACITAAPSPNHHVPGSLTFFTFPRKVSRLALPLGLPSATCMDTQVTGAHNAVLQVVYWAFIPYDLWHMKP